MERGFLSDRELEALKQRCAAAARPRLVPYPGRSRRGCSCRLCCSSCTRWGRFSAAQSLQRLRRPTIRGRHSDPTSSLRTQPRSFLPPTCCVRSFNSSSCDWFACQASSVACAALRQTGVCPQPLSPMPDLRHLSHLALGHDEQRTALGRRSAAGLGASDNGVVGNGEHGLCVGRLVKPEVTLAEVPPNSFVIQSRIVDASRTFCASVHALDTRHPPNLSVKCAGIEVKSARRTSSEEVLRVAGPFAPCRRSLIFVALHNHRKPVPCLERQIWRSLRTTSSASAAAVRHLMLVYRPPDERRDSILTPLQLLTHQLQLQPLLALTP